MAYPTFQTALPSGCDNPACRDDMFASKHSTCTSLLKVTRVPTRQLGEELRVPSHDPSTGNRSRHALIEDVLFLRFLRARQVCDDEHVVVSPSRLVRVAL